MAIITIDIPDGALSALRLSPNDVWIGDEGLRTPKTVLSRCEWGRDDYNLEVANLPAAPAPIGQQGLAFEER